MANVVRIGHARIDERGKSVNGVAGDQNGQEVCITDFYMHSKGWYVLRAKDPKVAEKIAKCMEDACANPNVGYDQYGRNTLYNATKPLKFKCDISTLKVKVECDCSSLVRVCLAYAGVEVQDFYTGNEKSIILATGKFDCLECEKDGANLKRGDILVTKIKGHTVVVLTDGANYQKKEEPKPTVTNDVIGTAVAKGSVRVRNGASTSGTSTIGYISKGQTVEVLEVLSNGWYKIVWKKASCGYGYTSNAGNRYYTYTAKTTEPSKPSKPKVEEVVFNVGDKVRMQKDAPVYGSTKKFQSWVYNKTLYVRRVEGARIVVSTLKVGPVTGAVDKKYLTKI